MSDLAAKVRAARERKGYSQQELADRAGVSQTTIDKIEQGKTKNSRYLIQISRALGVDIFDLHEHSNFLKNTADRRAYELDSEHVPVYRSTLENIFHKGHWMALHGQFVIDATPFDQVKLDAFSDTSIVYGIYIGNDYLSPEVDAGDIVIVDPNKPIINGATCVFGRKIDVPDVSFGDATMDMRIVGRLLDSPGDRWRVLLHKPPRAILLEKAFWTLVHRVVTKLYRN